MDLGLNLLSHEDKSHVDINALKHEIKELDRIEAKARLREQALENIDLLRDNLNRMPVEDRSAVIRYFAMSNEALSDLTVDNYDNKLKDLLVSNEFTLIELLVVVALISMIAGIFGTFIAKALQTKNLLKEYCNDYDPAEWSGDNNVTTIKYKDIQTIFKGGKLFYGDIEKICKNFDKYSIAQIFGYATKMGMTIKEQKDTSFIAASTLSSSPSKTTGTEAGFTAQNIKAIALEGISVVETIDKVYKAIKDNKETIKADKQKVKALKFMVRVANEELSFALAYLIDVFEACVEHL